ncbi:hypothetical protein ACWKWU_16510 [Chitinophaga lutea]
MNVADFLAGKKPEAVALFEHFVAEFKRQGAVSLRPTKTMVAVEGPNGSAAYITQVGKNFVHAVFPFDQPFADNLCFIKIAQVPGDRQHNHHFRMFTAGDVNEEVKGFMRRALGL